MLCEGDKNELKDLYVLGGGIIGVNQVVLSIINTTWFIKVR